MTNQEFQIKLNEMFEKHPIVNKSNPKSLNELMYVLRVESDTDYSISTNDGLCIPSVKTAFVPVQFLQQKVLNIEYEEEECEEQIYPIIIIDLK